MNCPTCGAPVLSDATQCEHCGSRLAVVACPSCFGMVFAGAKFCSHCGAAIARQEVDETAKLPCPRCKGDMQAIVIGQTNLRECASCEGIWADTESLQRICADREQQSAVLGVAQSLPTAATNLERNIRYVPCPVCKTLMNRVAFAHCSGVVVDVCRQHGTWFDKDELQRIVKFIRAGGLEKARIEEIEELERKRQQLRTAQTSGSFMTDTTGQSNYYGDKSLGIASAAANLITSFFFK
jgi:Zn-finger nucleic acid-binding protein